MCVVIQELWLLVSVVTFIRRTSGFASVGVGWYSDNNFILTIVTLIAGSRITGGQ